MTANAPLRLAVLTGSTREGRFGPRLSQWMAQVAADHGTFEVDVIDLADYGFPAPMGEGHPKAGRYPEALRPYAERVAAADAFILVTPEYNHGYPASLKAALDALFAEWNAKPAAFVSYGGASGGLRAVEQLRQVLAELHVMDIREVVALPMAPWTFFAEDGSVTDESVNVAAKNLLEQLAWWALTLREGRRQRPYSA